MFLLQDRPELFLGKMNVGIFRLDYLVSLGTGVQVAYYEIKKPGKPIEKVGAKLELANVWLILKFP